MEKSLLKQSFQKAIQSFKVSLPMMFGILLLISLLNTGWQGYYERIFTGNVFLDPLIGALAGSISFGIPIVSYIAGGELLEQGVSLLAVTAFMLAWATVGIAMLPLEAKFLGWRFALVRNAVNFIFAIVIAILTVYTI
ncbi:MAG: hypothetical protein U9M90_02690 [Patescibacteria group bacterium]|nr:hypothetical protein [Patescibacteria group bacterium]